MAKYSFKKKYKNKVEFAWDWSMQLSYEVQQCVFGG